jgi:ribosomal protein S27AE
MPFVPHKTISLIIALALLAVVTWVDYATGYEISVFFLYVFPLAWTAWFLGLSSGLWLSLLVTLAHLWTDWARGLHYSHDWIAWERGLANFVLCAFIVLSIHTLRRGRKTDRERIRQLEELLQICPNCGRINHADDQWVDLKTCLRERPTTQPERRLCPACAAARELADYPPL